MSSTIKSKDQKILWARAAGLCSRPDCRKKLTLDKDNSGSLTLGEMAHIVGEKNNKKSARGISKLPLGNRNDYSNLILLCASCHTEIDKNEESWPIEILHKIKDEHELWVEESLSLRKINPEDIVYTNIIDNLETVFQLDNWNWFIDHAVRNIIHTDFINSLDFINERILAIDWPKKNLDIENSIQNVMKSYSDFIIHFLKYSTLSENSEFYKEDTWYKRFFPNPDYNKTIKRNNLWIKKNFLLLAKYVYYLNLFVKEVRKNINPLFYLKKGKFLIIDTYGMHTDGNSFLMLPELNEVDKHLKIVNNEIDKLE